MWKFWFVVFGESIKNHSFVKIYFQFISQFSFLFFFSLNHLELSQIFLLPIFQSYFYLLFYSLFFKNLGVQYIAIKCYMYLLLFVVSYLKLCQLSCCFCNQLDLVSRAFSLLVPIQSCNILIVTMCSLKQMIVHFLRHPQAMYAISLLVFFFLYILQIKCENISLFTKFVEKRVNLIFDRKYFHVIPKVRIGYFKTMFVLLSSSYILTFLIFAVMCYSADTNVV